ncbi:MAG: FG-GAP-like repeat-containing protein, partial [Candidatus Heimdallarchaeota archaeon]|nr:FG-GAP-like repeat-containing protein [Candidatus Heimdallarchaeota archaeon]
MSAGPDQSVTLPSSALLAGSASDDGLPVGSVLSVLWSVVSGPAGVTFTAPNEATTEAVFSAPGEYVLRLTASDGELTSSADVVVNVLPAPPQPDLSVPAVDASGLSINTQTLEVVGSVVVELSNLGGGPASGFAVTLFEDLNGSGALEPAEDVVLAEASLSGLGAGAATSLEVPLAGRLSFANSSIHAFADSGLAVLESDESNNYGSSAPPCEPRPRSGPLSVKVEWVWNSSDVLPESVNLESTPMVADLTGDGIAEVVFVSWGPDDFTRGPLRALDGRDGRELFTVSDPTLEMTANGQLAVGDIDGDGRPEIVGMDAEAYRNHLLAFEHDGTFKWRSAQVFSAGIGGASVADLDADGTAEVIMGRDVLDGAGNLRWSGAHGRGDAVYGAAYSLVADVNLDGSPDVVAGNTVYESTGEEQWYNPDIPDGYPALGNFDADAEPEIVLVTFNELWLLEHTGKVIWGPVSISRGGCNYSGGLPLVADVDGDGTPEIGVAGCMTLSVFERDGTVKWSTPVYDSSGITTPTVFDLNGDGRVELLYSDERTFRIFDGSTGAVLFEMPKGSLTAFENPVVADVDGDGHAEIVLGGDGTSGAGRHGITVLGDAQDNWVATRPIWNQHSYHVTNVNDDGTIPKEELNSWEVHNSYRQNILQEGCLFQLPDLGASHLRLSRGVDTWTLTARVGNGGNGPTGPGVAVSFYDGDPTFGAERLGTVSTTGYLAPGVYEDVRLTLPGTTTTSGSVWVVADDIGGLRGRVSETNETNNAHDSGLSLSASPGGLADLSVVSVDPVNVHSDPQTLSVSGTVGVSLRNQGEVASGAFAVTVFEDRDGDGLPGAGDAVLGTEVVSDVAAGATLPLAVSVSGTVSFRDAPLWAFADSAWAVVEGDESNNVGRSGSRCGSPGGGAAAPVVEWSWTGSAVDPLHVDVVCTPAVVDLNQDGIPDVVFISHAGSFQTGRLRAVSGRDGTELFTVTNSLWSVRANVSPAVGDIDEDGRVEIVALSYARHVIAFEDDGTLKWVGPDPADQYNLPGALSLADLNADGVPEIVAGGEVFSAVDGKWLWQGAGGSGSAGAGGSISAVADLNGDGLPEVVTGKTAYRGDGTILWDNPLVNDGIVAIANLDADPHPEIVAVYSGTLRVQEHDGSLKWGPVSGAGSAPTVADFNGDNHLDIGVASHEFYTVFNAQGGVVWSVPIAGPWGSSSAADLDGDGAAEIIAQDRDRLWVLRGSDGTVLLDQPLGYVSQRGYPVVADVDADGNAEIIAIADDFWGGSHHGLYVFGDANDTWGGTRSIWNQHTYHVTNVLDDGTIP